MDARGYRLTALGACVLGLGVSACTQFGIVHDGTSVAWGTTNRGVLINATQLPTWGDGFWMPPRWAARGLHYGTDELVSLVASAARRVEAESPGAVLGVGNLSPRGGGPSRWHGSHQNGRDVDLLFYARDARGEPLRLTEMRPFDEDGTWAPRGSDDDRERIFFDVERNWLLVRAILESPIASVQWIFVAEHLKQMLLDHAIARGERLGLVLKASYILHQPSNAPPHADHFHVRIFCPRGDIPLGCRNRGWVRWTKKDAKYARSPARVARAEHALREVAAAPMHAVLALEGLAGLQAAGPGPSSSSGR
jgi:penicillin-insensitive murein DD-endopeptidase